MGYQALLFSPDEKLARIVSQVFTELDFTVDPAHDPFGACLLYTSSASVDPLGRDTPSGTVLGFLQAAQDGNERTAADYLQMSAARRQSQGPEFVGKLKVLMDSAFVGDLRQFTRPEGNLDYGTSDQQTIGNFSTRDADVPVVLVRVADPNAGKIWLFSADMLSKVPELSDNVEAHLVENKLPQRLVRNAPLGMPLWQWLALFIAIPVALSLIHI